MFTSCLACSPRSAVGSSRHTLVILFLLLCVSASPVLAQSLVTQETKLNPNDGAAGDNFAFATAIDGNTAVVGSFGDDTAAGTNAGSAYVYVRNGTTWTQQAKLTASDAAAGDLFGNSVAINGDTIVVSAASDDTAAGAGAGSIYVFVRTGTTWSEQAHLFGTEAAANDFFGEQVSIDNNTIIVAAQGTNTAAGNDVGAAYIFARDGTSWSLQAKLTPGDAVAGAFFGFSVSIVGDTAIMGYPRRDTAAGVDAGAAYVFTRNGATWTEQARLMASDGTSGDIFGEQVALDGDTVAITAPNADSAIGAGTGAVYVFTRAGETWFEQAKLVAADARAPDFYSSSIALDGDTLVVGAYFDDTAAGEDAGSAYIFKRSGMTWSERVKLMASDAAAFDRFGEHSVGIDGDTIIVGARLDDTTAGANVGSAYVFRTQAALQPCFAPIVTTPANVSYLPAGGTGSIQITADSGCAWQATSDARWLTLTSPTTGTGNGVLNYTIAASDFGSTRATTINVSGSALNVTQSPPVNTWAVLNNSVDNVNAVAVARTNQSVIYAATNYGLLIKSTDAGATWRTLVNFNTFSKPFFALAVDPTNADVVYAGFAGGLYKHTGTSGATVFTLQAAVKGVAVDPNNPNIVYAGGHYHFTGGNSDNFPTFKSTDAGATWFRTGNGGEGYTNVYAASLTLNPFNPNVIYIGTVGGIIRSTDGGATYPDYVNFLGDSEVTALIVDPTNGDTIYAGTSAFSNENTHQTFGAGIFKTTNGGESISQINNGLTNTSVLAFAINPANTQTLYAGTYGGGVFRSANAGASWSAFNSGLSGTAHLRVNSLQIDSTGQRLIAGNDDGVFAYQQSDCPYRVSTTVQTFALSGGAGSVAVTTGGGCVWTTTSDADWIQITSSQNASGTQTATYTVASNTAGATRAGTLTVAGQTVTVRQAGRKGRGGRISSFRRTR